MVTQREVNNMERNLSSSINDANELLQESKSMGINESNIGILLACKESIEEQLTNYDKQRNEQNDSLEEKKMTRIQKIMKTLLTLEKVMNKLKGIILGFKHHMESIEKEKTRQFEEIMRKERLELEKQEHERELE